MELLNYSVQEDAIPLNPSKFSGGYGQASVTKLRSNDDKLQVFRTQSFSDEGRGVFSGTVRGVDTNDEVTSWQIDSDLADFNKWVSVPPRSGTLDSVISALMKDCGVSLTRRLDPSVIGRNVVFPGFEGNAWDNLRQFAAIQNLDISQVDRSLVIRPIRTFSSYDNKDISRSSKIDVTQTTEQLTVYWYDIKPGRTIVALEGLSDDSPITVDAGQTVVQQFSINGSATSARQPIARDLVPKGGGNLEGSNGAYCVAGNDGKPITAAQWTAQGGLVSVSVTSDPSILEVTVTAPRDSTYAPYRIAATSGPSNYYNSLYVSIDGLVWEKNSITMHTGAPRQPNALTTETEFDSPFVQSISSAWDVALKISQDLCGGVELLTGSSGSLNRPDDRMGEGNATVEEFNTFFSGQTVAQFNTFFSGQTVAQFNAFWEDRVRDSLINQAFGQVVGSRLRKDDAFYRVESTITTPEAVQYELRNDTLVQDINAFFVSNGISTVADFNAWYAGCRAVDFTNTPLRTEGRSK